MILMLLITVLVLSGCNMNIDVYQKVYKTGVQDMRFEITSDNPAMLNMLKQQMYKNLSSNLTVVEDSTTRLVLEAKNLQSDKNRLNVVESGNWFKHKYVITQDAVMANDNTTGSEMAQSIVTGNLYMTVPGRIDWVAEGCIKKDSHTASCSLYQQVWIESSCYLFFC